MMRKLELEQIAVMSIHYQFYPLRHFFDTVRELGIKNVDLWAGYPHFLIGEDWFETANEIRRMADERGIKIVCCTPEQVRYPLNLASEQEKIRRRTVEYLKRSVDAAVVLGADRIQAVPGYGWYDTDKEPAWRRLVHSLQELCRYAAEKNITVLLEPLQIIESNLVNYRFDAQRIIRDVGNSALKIVVDTTHMSLRGETLQEYFDLLPGEIGYIHLNESDQVPWGEGNLDLGTFLETLAQYGYDGICTLEICSLPHYVDADQSLSDSVSYVKAGFVEKFG